VDTLVRPGRSCPVSYRYRAEAIGARAAIRVEALWIAGGLYGNVPALRALLDAYHAEPGVKALVFNGDFHWFDVDPADFRLVNETALGFHAMRGNVETEIAAPGDGAGCGCAYPDWVGDATVEHSNRIIERLRATARGCGAELARLAALPMHLAARVGDATIGIVHGDGIALAGWGFSQEALATRAGYAAAAAAFAAAGVDIFASSHTCLPVLQRFENDALLVNNGAAGMPNFRGTTCGVATRIALRPSTRALYSARRGEVVVEAIALEYDNRAWQERFLSQWQPGSDAYRSYWERIARGPAYDISQALRPKRARAAQIAAKVDGVSSVDHQLKVVKGS
jgi:predicted phosphodiesterase